MISRPDRPHIVMIHKAYPPQFGGIERHLRDLSEALAERNWRVTVLTCNEDRFETRETIRGVNIIRVPRWGTVFSQPIVTRYFRRLRSPAPDLVHAHVPFPLAWPAVQRIGASIPVVCTWHSDIVRQQRLMKWLSPCEQKFLRRCARIIVTSEPLLASSTALQPHRQRCRVVPLAIPHSPARDTQNTLELAEVIRQRFPGRIALFVGRLVGYKGLPYLIDAMQRVPATLLIVGDGPLRRTLERQVAAMGMQSKIHFLGRVAEQEKQALYRAADVFVLPSITKNEAFGYVLLEAMQAGCPVISTNLPTGVAWVNRHEETGLVVPPADAKALADALKVLLNDDAMRLRCSSLARARVEREFQFMDMIADIESLYREMLP